jgi:pantothenate kinase
MVPHEGEPAAGPWRVISVAELWRVLLDAAGPRTARPVVLGIGGRSSSGKTTLAGRLAAGKSRVAVLHTDDIAWRQAVLDWDGLLLDGVLAPVRRGHAVAYRPPKWAEYGRSGAIKVPSETAVLIVEGVGATRRALAPVLDATIWVQADAAVLEQRDEARIAAGETTAADRRAWMAEERPFLLDDRAWERATVIVAGSPELPHEPTAEVVVADGVPR